MSHWAQLASTWFLSCVGITVGFLLGLTTPIPVATQKVLCNPLTVIFASNMVGHPYFDGDVAGLGVTILFFWWIRSIASAAKFTFDSVVQPATYARWKDPAPYLLGESAYGYSMVQYRVKKKSGHARPKSGGETQPITFLSSTSRLAHNSFTKCLALSVVFCILAVIVSACDLWWNEITPGGDTQNAFSSKLTMLDKPQHAVGTITATSPNDCSGSANDSHTCVFEPLDMVSWRLRRLIRRRDARMRRNLLRWSRDTIPLPPPPPEPPPSSSLECNVDLWSRLVSNFIDSFDPSEITKIELDELFSARKVITLPLSDPRSCWKRWIPCFTRACLHSLEMPCAYKGQHDRRIPLIVDSGASVCISPLREDFIVYRQSNAKIKDLSKSNAVAGEGIVRWKVRDTNGKIVNLDLPAYHIDKAEVRLLSPQVLLGTVGSTAKGVLTTADLILCLGNGVDLRARYCPRSNLPLLDIFDEPPLHRSMWHDAFHITGDAVQAYALEKHVLDESNANLSASQKELLLWHHRLSHASISWLQPLMRTKKWLKSQQSATALHTGPFLPCQEKRTATCSTNGLRCAACLASKATIRSAGARHESHDTPSRPQLQKLAQRVNGQYPKRLKRGHLNRGDCVSADHYMSSVPGRLEHTFGRERRGYTCGTLFVDHATSKIFNFCQLSNDASETVESKHKLEQLARHEGFEIGSYHSDNGVFAAKEFTDDCERLRQKVDFSGVGAQHQNGVAERNIKTVTSWARANMLHAAYHWPQFASIKLWPMAISYAVWVYNHLPRVDTGLCPDEMWSQSRTTHDDLRRAHVWGCPVYVLEPALQDGKKIPKWLPRARLGMFVGFSSVHSSLVPLVLNVHTGKISPQYHVVFDDKFSTVHSLPSEDSLDKQWEQIFKLDKEFYLDIEYDDNGNIKTDEWPRLNDEWLDPRERGRHILSRPRNVASGGDNAPGGDRPSVEARASGGADAPRNVDALGDSRSQEVVTDSGGARLRRAQQQTWQDGPARLRSQPPDEFEPASFSTARVWGQPPAAIANLGHSVPSEFHPNSRLKKGDLAVLSIMKDPWDDVDRLDLSAFLVRDPYESHLIESSDPRLLQAKTSKYDADNPSWADAFGGEFAGDFWKACEKELDTLQNDVQAWTYVKRTPEMKVLPSTWAFKIKRYPDGSVKKFKARFCVRGDRQEHGVNFWEVWSPVVQWSTIRTVMILAAKEGWASSQCDITAAFATAPMPDDEVVYVQQPRGFVQDPSLVLKLRTCLYGMRQSPRYFFGYLSDKLQGQGLRPSELDPCLFYGKDLLVISYIDDLLIYAKRREDITDLIQRLKDDHVNIREEGTAEGYLGLQVERDGRKVTLSQPGLIRRVVEALGLSSKYSTAMSTPAEQAALPRDKDGDLATGTFNYPSVVGMLNYLGHTRPDCAFAIHQCARYTFEPKKIHEVALKRLGRYLKGTMDKGLILDPSDDYVIDCYPDADFAGLWGHEHPQDPHCVRSRTGYVITLANCPILWKSKLQTEIALSTMEAEYVALSTACKDLFPVMDLVKELGTAFDLPIRDKSRFHVRVHEDNVGALTLGKLEPRRMTPRSKHYAVKYHWFRSQLEPRGVTLHKIDSAEQLGDIFTKGLGRIAFERLRKKLMGW